MNCNNLAKNFGIYLGLGSNLGNKITNLIKAKDLLNSHNGINVIRLSKIYESEPYGIAEQPFFLNAAIEIETSHSPTELLKIVKQIEKEIGRIDTYRWGPRLIDIDILLYKDLVIDSQELIIPHQEIDKRLFVIAPLNDIYPNQTIPRISKSVNQVYNNLTESGQKIKIYSLNEKEKAEWYKI